MTELQYTDAIVIGAGLSGLTAAQELRARGISVVILEASDQVGASWRARHPQLRLNIHRHFVRLPRHSNIKDKDTFLRRDSVVDYLKEYAELTEADIRFDTKVGRVHRDANVWHVATNNGPFSSAHLIVATGRERLAHIPAWPGLERYRGEIIHAENFKDPSEYDGKNVLVIGAGNSGTDVLNHLSRNNPGQVWVSVRHGPAILPTRIFGFPLHRLATVLANLPKALLDPTFAVVQRAFLGDLRRHGLPHHPTGGGSRMLNDGVTFALDDGFVAALKSGRFEVVAETDRFTPQDVELTNGQKIRPDVVICATGYSAGLVGLFEKFDVLDAKGYPKSPSGEPSLNNPGLWFTGYAPIFQGFFHAAGINARSIANNISKQLCDMSNHVSK